MTHETTDMDGVGRTSLMVAAMRAVETERKEADGRLCDDPFARSLAGPAGFDFLDATEREAGDLSPIIAIRTRFVDEQFARALSSGIRQIVLLAAGMDSRALRIAMPPQIRLFELDRPAVLTYKRRLQRAPLHCERIAVPADLRDAWPIALVQAGFDRSARTLFVAEGLLQFLDAPAVASLLTRIDEVAISGSAILFEILSRELLDAPWMVRQLRFLEKMGVPWIFGHDNPAGLMHELCLQWALDLVDPSEIGGPLGRWKFPAAAPGTIGGPRSFLISAVKR